MSMIEGILVFSTIVLGYILIVAFLQRKGMFEKYNISLWGPALLLRTEKGKRQLERIARKKRFWKYFGNFGIILCFIMMAVMMYLLISQAWMAVGFTPAQKEAIPSPRVILPIPGVNPVLPLEYVAYILLALVIGVVAHEFTHGILTYVSKLKVKSLGILYLVLPIGAFCEPDEEQLMNTTHGKRMRIFAAGPTMNFVVVLISILLFSFVLMSAVQPAAEGITIVSIGENTPADNSTLTKGAIITSINNSQITNTSDFFYIMENTSANQTVNISFVKKDERFATSLTLIDKYAAYERMNYSVNESYKGKGFLGVTPSDIHEGFLGILKNPFARAENFLYFFVLPFFLLFQGYNPIIEPFIDSYVVSGALGVVPSSMFWMMVNALYWIFWLNLAVALFNVLPAVPLDGGYLFKDGLSIVVTKIRGKLPEEEREKIVNSITFFLSLLILLLIVFPWLIKYV